MGINAQNINSNLNPHIPYGTNHFQSNTFPSNNFYWDWWNNYYQSQSNFDIANIKEEANKK